MIKCVGQITFKDSNFAEEMTYALEDKGLLLEAIYTDNIIAGYRIYDEDAGTRSSEE